MNVLVAYESRSGHTRQAAEAIAVAARKLGYEAVVKPVSEVRTQDVQKANALFIGTWVSGLVVFGARPAGARKWVPALPSLKGKPTAVFCTYAFNPRGALKALSTMLEARGATILGNESFSRSQPGAGAEKFVRSVLAPVAA